MTVRPALACFFLAASALLASARPAAAGDVTVFVAQGFPSDQWSRGYGAALASTWFRVLIFEGEAARLPGEDRTGSLTTFTASALLGPPVGGLTPYGGVGVGVFRQSLADDSDLGTLRALVLGVRFKVKELLVLKAEYRRIDLSGDPLVTFDQRFSAGAGIAF